MHEPRFDSEVHEVNIDDAINERIRDDYYHFAAVHEKNVGVEESRIDFQKFPFDL